MVTAGDFRNGVTFEMDGNVYSIIEFQHVKPGKGAAFVRTKIRNVISGAVTEKTFNPNDKFPTAFIERKDMEYLYMPLTVSTDATFSASKAPRMPSAGAPLGARIFTSSF